MTFVNLSLLAGALGVAIPIVLHLMMRQRPRPMIFPALRFIQQRREANSRRLQLRHWLLLALRCGAVALLALALARPSVASAALGNWITVGLVGAAFLAVAGMAVAAVVRRTSLLLTGVLGVGALALGTGLLWFTAGALGSNGQSVLGDEESPVAAVLAIDTSPRMTYQHENRERLAVAQETAAWLLKQLPADSQVALVDARSGPAAFSVDRAAAAKSLERLKATGATRSMPEVLRAALALADSNELKRKEVYLFSDLSRASWPSDVTKELQQALDEHSDVLVYVIDVGVERPRNVSLGDLKLSGQLLAQSGTLEIETSLAALGPGGEKTVELIIEEADATLPVLRDGKLVTPKAVRRGSKSVQLDADGSQQLRFEVSGLEPGVHQGQVRMLGGDTLPWDDTRYFAVEVQPAWPVLIVAPPGVSTDYLTIALAPPEYRDNEQARFQCEVISQTELQQRELIEFRAVCLLDPTPPNADVWEKLAKFVDRGGGLAIFLGHNAQAKDFQTQEAVRVVGGKLTRQTRSGGDLFLAPRTYDHPILAAFRQIDSSVPWNHFPIFYHWNLTDLAPQARVVIPYGDNLPALVDNRLGRGHVLTMTTPISDPLRPAGRSPWNELAAGEDPWPCFVLVNEMLLHLVGSGEMKLNFLTGEAAALPNDETRQPDRYQLFTPREETQDVLSRDGRVTVRFTDAPGAYRLRGNRSGPVARGFAVNVPAAASDMSRIERSELDDRLGKDRYKFARNQNEIDRAVGHDRIGTEFYPVFALLLALVVGLEQLLANTFYRKEE